MYEIIPGILEKDWTEIERKINLVKGFAKTIHVDIIDGKFAPNSTFLDSLPFKKFTSDLFFELHMMVEEPINYLKPFANAGFKRFLGHIEKMSDQAEFVVQAQALGEVGLAVDSTTPISAIKIPYQDLDCILVMTVKLGQSHQEFILKCLEKVRRIREKDKFVNIEVDGGINDKTIVKAKEEGATRFVSTSFIFNPLEDLRPQKQFNLLQERIQQ